MALLGCQISDTSLCPVLTPENPEVSMTNRSGELKVRYLSPTERVISWNGVSRTIALKKGSKWRDIYTGNAHFRPIGDIERAVYEEAIQIFPSKSAYEEWRKIAYHDVFYDAKDLANNIVFGFNVDRSRNQIGIELFKWKIVPGRYFGRYADPKREDFR